LHQRRESRSAALPKLIGQNFNDAAASQGSGAPGSAGPRARSAQYGGAGVPGSPAGQNTQSEAALTDLDKQTTGQERVSAAYSAYKSVDDSVFGDIGQLSLEKASLRNEPCTLHNIARYLKALFDKLELIKDQDLVIALGNTGCGKSTMLTSLLYGPEALEEKKLRNRTVIENKGEQGFKIGHSQATSETFLPAFERLQEDQYFVDVAGLQDTSGDLVEFLTSFVSKAIFTRARQVKFLFPVTQDQIKESRGLCVRQ